MAKRLLVAFSYILLVFNVALLPAQANESRQANVFSTSDNDDECENATDPDRDCENRHQTLLITSIRSPFAGLKPTTQASTLIELDNQVTPATTLTELSKGVAGVAENGQPGFYQVISIRGMSRQRVLTILDGIRLTNDRRAGVAASFVDPLFLDSVQITRGPVSTYYGSGAIGGVTQMHFNTGEQTRLAVGYEGLGNQQFQLAQWGNSDTNLALSKRHANNSEDITGNPLNTHFDQTAAFIQQDWRFNDSHLESWLYHSSGKDIGRSNSRYPDRIVNIPTEKHTLFRSSLTNNNRWVVDFYLHDQSITTATLKPEESLSNVTSESLDFGANWQVGWQQIDHWSIAGLDYFARRHVSLEENNIDLADDSFSRSKTLDNGKVDELAIFYTYHQKVDHLRMQFGGRYTLQNSSQANTNQNTDDALTGFAGVAYELTPNFEVNANIGNGFRFASLSERFFSGTTARGTINGNPNLKAEQAISYDIGVNWQQEHQRLKASYFLTQFDHYVERINLAEQQLTFVNSTDGEINGVELEYFWNFATDIEFNLLGSWLTGNSTINQPLADIPSDRINLFVNYRLNDGHFALDLEHRFSKSDVGNGELATNAANLMNLSYSFSPFQQWQLKIYARNLLNVQYKASADDLSTLAAGRNFGITIDWHDD